MKKIFLLIIFITSTIFAQNGFWYVKNDTLRPLVGTWTAIAQDAKWYGVKYDLDTDTFERTGTLNNDAIDSKPAEVDLTVHNQLRRCVVSDAGVVQYYLDDDNSYLKAEGDSAKLDGTDGQVMVEIPKFWYYYNKSANIYEWAVSPVAQEGFSVHPVFVDSAGNELDAIYIGAFPGALYDASASDYLAASSSSIYASGDKLSSVVGYKPSTDETRAEYRAAAEERGTGWHQLSAEILSAVQLLFVTEYASFDSQAMIGDGNVEFSSWDYSADISQTGKSLLDGNSSGGQTTVNGDSTDYVSYRGIEDLWGNTWQFVDGVNINDDGISSKLYVANDYRVFADDVSTNYTYVGNLADADGYISNIINYSNGFYPLETSGSSSTYLADYYYTSFDSSPSGGWRVLLVGGFAINGSSAGVFFVTSNHGSTLDSSTIGGRLCFSGAN